jgi:hypothetical protein
MSKKDEKKLERRMEEFNEMDDSRELTEME